MRRLAVRYASDSLYAAPSATAKVRVAEAASRTKVAVTPKALDRGDRGHGDR